MDSVRFWSIVSYLGDAHVWIGIAVALLIVYPFSSKKTKSSLAWVIVVLLPAILVSHEIGVLIKEWTMVPRPCWGTMGCPLDYSFPSGHATVIFTFATVFSFIIRKARYTIPAFVLALLVALSRVFLGYHSFEDIMGGAILGFVVGILFCVGYRSWCSSYEKNVRKRR